MGQLFAGTGPLQYSDRPERAGQSSFGRRTDRIGFSIAKENGSLVDSADEGMSLSFALFWIEEPIHIKRHYSFSSYQFRNWLPSRLTELLEPSRVKISQSIIIQSEESQERDVEIA